MSAVRLWLKNRMAVCQLVVTCVFSVVCALTDPTGVTVPAVFGSMGTVVVVANLFGLVSGGAVLRGAEQGLSLIHI